MVFFCRIFAQKLPKMQNGTPGCFWRAKIFGPARSVRLKISRPDRATVLWRGSLTHPTRAFSVLILVLVAVLVYFRIIFTFSFLFGQEHCGNHKTRPFLPVKSNRSLQSGDLRGNRSRVIFHQWVNKNAVGLEHGPLNAFLNNCPHVSWRCSIPSPA